MNNNMITTKVTILKGAIGDMAAEWFTEDDWKKHAEYVEELKAKGEYLKPEEVTISYKPDPLFDEPFKLENTIKSYRMVFLDMSE